MWDVRKYGIGAKIDCPTVEFPLIAAHTHSQCTVDARYEPPGLAKLILRPNAFFSGDSAAGGGMRRRGMMDRHYFCGPCNDYGFIFFSNKTFFVILYHYST